MKRGDVVWVPHPGLGGGPMHARPWRVAHCGLGMVDLAYMGQVSSCAPGDAYSSREACEAAIALRAATEAVAKARDAVVEAARLEVAGGDGPPIWQSVVALEELERAEAEARARLEALR